MKRILAVICAIWLLTSLTLAQSPSITTPLTSATCPGSGCTTLSVQGLGSVGVQVTGTFVGTLQFESSLNGITYTSLSMTPSGGGMAATSATAPGLWTWESGALVIVRVRFSAYTSGTATVTIQGALGGLTGATGASGADGSDGATGATGPTGTSSLPLQVAADGDQVLLNHDGDTIVGTDDAGEVKLVAKSGQLSFGFLQGEGSALAVIENEDTDTYITLTVDDTAGQVNVYGPGGAFNLPLALGSPLQINSSGLNASLTTDLGIPNADLTWTATSVGPSGNAIQIVYADGVALAVAYVAPVLTITINTGVTTAQDIIDLGSYDSAPVGVPVAAGGDATGVVIAISATNLSGGLAALNVAGPSWLDSGAITTDGAGTAVFAGTVTATDFIMSGSTVKTDTTDAHTGSFQAYDVNDTTYRTFATLTNGNTPAMALSAPSGGTLTGSFTTITGLLTITSTVVGSLGTCDGGSDGQVKYVTDALLPASLAIVAAGGAVRVPVLCNGTSWIVF